MGFLVLLMHNNVFKTYKLTLQNPTTMVIIVTD